MARFLAVVSMILLAEAHALTMTYLRQQPTLLQQDPQEPNLGAATDQATGAIDGMGKGDVPTAGEALGKQTGVDVPNPHKYLGALIGGGSAGAAVSILIFLVATYYVYKWNKAAKEEAGGNPDKEPHCGCWSCLCCIFCTPTVICCPIDVPCDEEKCQSSKPSQAAKPSQPPAPKRIEEHHKKADALQVKFGKIFDEIDKNKNGIVSHREMKAFVATKDKAAQLELGIGKWQDFLKNAGDEENVVTKDDFISYFTKHNLDPAACYGALFDDMDEDNSGFITAKEVKAYKAHKNPKLLQLLGAHNVHEEMEKMHADGKISRKAFVDYYTKKHAASSMPNDLFKSAE